MVDLSAIRDPSRRIPAERHVDASPLDTQHLLAHPIEKRAAEIAASFPPNAIVALDLDDTLLAISYRDKNAWNRLPANGLTPPTRTSTGLLHRLLRRRSVTVQPRPGVIGAIAGWRSAGITIAIISATAQLRSRFLISRLPFLDLPIACGEQIAAALTKLPDHPRTLAAKTPTVFEQTLGLPPFDLLIDDSTHTARVFQERELSCRLLKVSPLNPNSSYFIDVLKAAKRRLQDPTGPASGEVRFSAAPLRDYPFLRLEDPYYFPLMNLTDILPA